MMSPELLRAVAAALDDGQDPFAWWFLAKHDVVPEDSRAMAGQLAAGARIVARAMEDPQSAAGVAYLLALAETAS